MNKKVIIVEGCDRTGKDSLIKKLALNFNCPAILHSSAPPSGVNNAIKLFEFYNSGIIHSTLDYFYDKEHDVIIHNRSMYGEFVYGPKYRSKMPSEVAEMIYKLEKGQLRTFIRSSELYFVLLTSSDVDLLVGNDDGNSISNKREDILDELKSFDTIFGLSTIENKKKIYVNNGSKFRSKDDIYKEVNDFINDRV